MIIRTKLLLAVFLIGVCFAISCVKDSFYWDRITVYQPNLPSDKPVLEIVVMDWNASGCYEAYINKCKVKLYKSKSDYDQNINATDSSYTNLKGAVAFIVDSTQYWMRCEQDCRNNDIFNAMTLSPISRYKRNKEVVLITGTSKLEVHNNTAENFYLSAVYPGITSYIDLVPAHDYLNIVIAASATSILAEPENFGGLNREFPITARCGGETLIDIR